MMSGAARAIGAAVAALVIALAVGAQDNASTQLQRRLASVAALIEKSSGAKQVEASGNSEAQARRATARDLHQQAARAIQAGDQSTAAELLDEASKTMIEAVRLAAPEQVTVQKDRRDFSARMESALALIDAQKRVAEEKSDPNARESAKAAESLLQEASQLAAAGRLPEGRKVLDRAYLLSKAAVANLRAGDTLVRSLHFANKEEEYRYELDRNDTHAMLVQVLLQDKRGNAGIDAMVNKAIGVAADLRKRAEQRAVQGDFDGGVKTLEESTRELVKAIRAAGVYIPG